MLGVFHGRLGVPVPLDDDALGFVVVEVGVVLQRSGVLGLDDLHGLSGQALEILELALVDLEPTDTHQFTHGSASWTFLVLDRIEMLDRSVRATSRSAYP